MILYIYQIVDSKGKFEQRLHQRRVGLESTSISEASEDKGVQA